MASYFAVTVSSKPEFAPRQLIFIIIGLASMYAVSRGCAPSPRAQVRLLRLSILGLVLVLLFGAVLNGQRLAIVIGPIQIQWSELAKVLFRAEHRRRARGSPASDRILVDHHRILGLTAPVLILLLLEPDLGSTLVFVVMLLLMMGVAGTPLRHFRGSGGTAAAFVVAVVLVLPALGVSVLAEYQTDRLTSFVNPSEAVQAGGTSSVRQ